jgi:hypothetical protein
MSALLSPEETQPGTVLNAGPHGSWPLPGGPTVSIIYTSESKPHVCTLYTCTVIMTGNVVWDTGKIHFIYINRVVRISDIRV